MSEISDYVDSKRGVFLEELKELLRIPSVSADPARKGDLVRCAGLVMERLRAAGLEASIHETGGHPAVYGERLAGPSRPTVLVYGHYDVQPPDPLELWRHGPFDPTEEGGFIVARGATDDKGQCYALLKGIEATLKTRGEAPVNIKVLIEGEEEIGSPHLGPFIRKEKARLACDTVVIADSSQFARGVPAITYGLKGLVYLEVIVRGPKKDLHSGSYGGSVANPANVLARLLAACQGPFGQVAIPGFYDNVRPIEPWEREELARLPFDEEAYRREVGAPRLFGEEGYSTLERRWARPTFDVNGLLGGFTGEGAKTVLPSTARAKFSMRLVPDQDPDRIAEIVTSFLHDIAPDTVEIEVLKHHGAGPVIVSRDTRHVQAAVRAYRTSFGKEPVFIREGGSIPVVNTFKAELGAQSLLLGLGLPDDDAHSPNEKFLIEDFYRGMVLMGELLAEIGP
ncbi:MAG TPA: dipeptidase [Planctomycetota bacterium]|nr:dipeptidase [Planctomycetota bacterium]